MSFASLTKLVTLVILPFNSVLPVLYLVFKTNVLVNTEHRNNLKHLKERHYKIINELFKLVGKVILRILLIDLCKSLRKSNILQLKTKKNKIRNRRPTHANKTSQVPVNLIMT